MVLKTARPDLTINLKAIDVSEEILEFAARGVYSLLDADKSRDGAASGGNTYRDQPPGYVPFMFMSESEKDAMFDRDGDVASVKPWIKEGIIWLCADAGDPELVSIVGPQDVIIANRFLCHMEPASADRILRNISRVAKPGGYLFVTGVDRVAMDMKWVPVTELSAEVHDGDPSIRDGWPFDYWEGTARLKSERRNHSLRIGVSDHLNLPTDLSRRFTVGGAEPAR